MHSIPLRFENCNKASPELSVIFTVFFIFTVNIKLVLVKKFLDFFFLEYIFLLVSFTFNIHVPLRMMEKKVFVKKRMNKMTTIRKVTAS